MSCCRRGYTDDRLEAATGRLRAVHVIAGLDPVYGGPSYCVPRLCEALAGAGAETTLLSVAARRGEPQDLRGSGYRDRRFAWDFARVPVLRALRGSRALTRALHSAAAAGDVIHNHGLWLLPNVNAGRAAARGQRPLVISSHGMLAPAALAFSRLKKRAFWALLQGPAVRGAGCLHATSDQEYEEIRAFGLANPVAIIPNGIDMPEAVPCPKPAAAGEPTVLSLGRIHPKKGLDRLLHAWSKIERGHPGWRLRIVGPGEAGHDDELRALAKTLGLRHVSVECPIYGAEKTRAYREASLFVLPTLNENFGLTVAEALAAGTPAIATKGAPWSGLEREGCGWWIDHGVEPLAAVLARAMALPDRLLAEMGARGSCWMVRDFSWDRAARDMLEVYRWLARAAEPPAALRFD